VPSEPRRLTADPDPDAPAATRPARSRAARPDPFNDLADESATITTDDAPVPSRPSRAPQVSTSADAPDEAVVDDRGRGSRRSRRGGEGPLRARQVQRIIRYLAPWSVLKVSFLFFLSLWLITLVAGVILWTGASSTGAIDNIESFIEELFGLERFAFDGPQILRGTVFGGFVLVVVGTAFSGLLAVLFNLIGDLTGGLRVTVIEVERARPAGGRSTET
jgi:hypothetical protein